MKLSAQVIIAEKIRVSLGDRMKNMIALLLLLLAGCAGKVIAPTLPSCVTSQFALAQAQVLVQYPDAGDPYSVKAEDFEWHSTLHRFECMSIAGVRGCFVAPNKIYHMGCIEDVVFHEAGHAILYALNDYRWVCSFSKHEGNPICW